MSIVEPGGEDCLVERRAIGRVTFTGVFSIAPDNLGAYVIRTHTQRRVVAGLLSMGCVVACTSESSVDPNPNPVTADSGFSILTLLHGSQSGAAEQTRDVAVDAQGNIYLTGGTGDPSFPTTSNAYQKAFGRGKPETSTGSEGNWDVFVMKFAPNGQLLWSTLLGGGNYDRAYAIEVDASGVYVAGRAGEGYPTTSGTIQPAFAGDFMPLGAYGKQDGFITKLSLDGATVQWSTFVGGPADEFIRDLAVGANSELYAAMGGARAGFAHITAAAYQETNKGLSDGAACRIAAGATVVRWCTFIGGSADDGSGPSVRLDGAGNLYFLQSLKSLDAPTTPGAYQTARGAGDVLLSKFSPQGALLYSTYFGGTGYEEVETHNLWVTPGGEAYIGVATTSTDIPTTTGAVRSQLKAGPQDSYVARLSADGSQLLAGTYIGGSGGDAIEGFGMDANGNVVIAGVTSTGFPAPAGNQQIAPDGLDGFIAVLSPTLNTVVDAVFIGGSAKDATRAIAVDVPRNVTYTVGDTESSNFPTTASAFLTRYSGRDGFLAGWRPK